MPKKQKPPGLEKWTWAEIRAGRKMSKGEKRGRRLAKSLGATERPDGSIQRPSVSDHPEYYLYFGGLLLFMIIMAIGFPNGCHAH